MPSRPAWAVIDVDAAVRNLAAVRRRVGKRQVLGVVKADAYGHGTARIGLALAGAGIDWLGVALVKEAAALRRAGVRVPILVLGVAQPEELPFYRRYELTPSLSSLAQLRLWCEWSRSDSRPWPVHLKVDTGMGRLGIPPAEFAAALSMIRDAPGLVLGGVSSHLADAERPDDPHNREQEDQLRELLATLRPGEREAALVHLANSAATLHRESAHFDMVRVGLALYGYDPAQRVSELEPVMSVYARVIQTRQLEAGAPVGYGSTWRAARPTRVGVLPLGYGDGYPRVLSNRASVLLGERRSRVIGTISMDLTCVDLTGIEADVGSRATILGGAIDATVLAEWADTIPYEILCGFGMRLSRRFRDAAGAPSATTGNGSSEP